MTKFIIETESQEYIISRVLFPTQKASGLVFILHGLAGFKEEAYLLKSADIFLAKGYAVCLYDARHAFGESSGELKNACFSNFIKDFQTVLNWAKNQDFYQEPFFALGHSLGAGAILHQASQNPDLFKGIVCLSPVYNGEKLLSSYQKFKPDFVAKWEKDKLLYKEKENDSSKNGYIHFNHLLDAQKYHLEKKVHTLTCPVLIVCGDKDISSTVEINETLFNSLNTNKELQVIKGGTHTYRSEENKKALESILKEWLNKNFNKNAE